MYVVMVRTRSTTTRDRNLRLRGAVSTGPFSNFLQRMFCSFSRLSVQFSQDIAPKCGQILPDFRVEKKAWNPVTSLVVMVFSIPKWGCINSTKKFEEEDL